MSYATIKDGRKLHTGTHRGCAIVAGRQNAEVVSEQVAAALIAGSQALDQLAELRAGIESAQAAQKHADALDVVDLPVPTGKLCGQAAACGWDHGKIFHGELRRAALAFNRHEILHGCGWSGGTLFGGNCHETPEGVETRFFHSGNDTSQTPEQGAASLAHYAREAYEAWSKRKDREGMRRAAELVLAAQAKDIEIW
jgi:hypothetical protein